LFQLFFIDFQLFYFQARLIPDGCKSGILVNHII